ncbi:phosphate--nucleotide phosphotransferase [Arthrobacter sp. MYb227]|uniref:PPK2 family polyphosphate kinase n=1 Tax=Arthrobacter sp. MYb227 TaxID=1848601 RepID=UPI000CFD77E8|nr:PPK2 family polyphosphate kinase [Arthrobacter sp. MYb227]PQZ95999.1 phosphate--nucleotide phosphotransferase [Arthrobacter sp. MYb227]
MSKKQQTLARILPLSAPAHELLRAPKNLDLSKIDPESTPGYEGDKESAKNDLQAIGQVLDERQERLFAASRAGATPRILLVLQAMDTAGKGGIVRHVVGLVDPQGVQHHAFKAPTDEEKSHDFLWRIEKELPEPGFIGVFDRSHYEDVLIHKVRGFADEQEILRRYKAINEFEARLIAEDTTIIKVMLHISKDEQRARLAERLDRPDKYWKFSPGDIDERELWGDYMSAYQSAIDETSTEAAGWHIIPANKKWYARLAVATLLREALEKIDPQWPAAEFDVEEQKQRLQNS